MLDADPGIARQLDGFITDDRNREFYGSRIVAMGVPPFGGWLRTLIDYMLEGRADQIACPTLAIEGEGDFASQSHELFDALLCEKRFHSFTPYEGAGGHCEGMGQQEWQEQVFSWLSEALPFQLAH